MELQTLPAETRAGSRSRKRPKSAATSSPTIRRSRSGRRSTCRPSSGPSTRRRPKRRWGCTCTSRSAASGASSAISASTPTRTPTRSRGTSTPCRARSTCTPTGRGLQGRQFEFVYFGGGTPSYLSNEQLQRLIERINHHWRWDAAKEVTFECEPGTLKESKLRTIKEIGVTRLSLGVEHFDDEVLSHQRPGPQVAGDRPGLPVGARGRLPADQHRPDRRHARRDRGQVEDTRSRRPSRWTPTA